MTTAIQQRLLLQECRWTSHRGPNTPNFTRQPWARTWLRGRVLARPTRRRRSNGGKLACPRGQCRATINIDKESCRLPSVAGHSLSLRRRPSYGSVPVGRGPTIIGWAFMKPDRRGAVMGFSADLRSHRFCDVVCRSHTHEKHAAARSRNASWDATFYFTFFTYWCAVVQWHWGVRRPHEPHFNVGWHIPPRVTAPPHGLVS